MSSVPVQIVVAAFQDEMAADQVADQLKAAQSAGQLSYKNLAVVRKNPEGKVKIKETGDMSFGPGAGIGAVVGGALGLFAGPAGLVAGAAAGGVIGGSAAALRDSGIPDERLEQFGDVLKPGNSAFVGIFEQVKVDKEVMKEIDQTIAEVVESMASDIAATLDAGQDVAYAFAVTEEGVVAKRAAVGDEAADIQGLVVTAEGVVAGQAAATEEGVAYEMAAATEDEVAYEAGVVTEEGAAVVDAYAEVEDEAQEDEAEQKEE